MFGKSASLTLPRRGPPTELGSTAMGLLTPISKPPKTRKNETKTQEEIRLSNIAEKAEPWKLQKAPTVRRGTLQVRPRKKKRQTTHEHSPPAKHTGDTTEAVGWRRECRLLGVKREHEA